MCDDKTVVSARAAVLESKRLLHEANEKRFDFRPLRKCPTKRGRKNPMLKKHLYEFPRPVWRKKKVRAHVKEAVKEEEDLDVLLAQYRSQEETTPQDVIDLTGDSDGETVVGAAFYATRSMGGQASSDESSDGTLSSSESSNGSECSDSSDCSDDSDNSGDLDGSGDIEYFNGDVDLPMVSRQSRVRTSALHIVRAILDTPQCLISTKHPTEISINCAFVIDTSKLEDAGDAKCDDCGAWKQTKTATTTLQVKFEEDGSVGTVNICLGKNKKRYHTLVRRHYTCKSSPDLSRHISVLLDPSGKEVPFQYIEYRFSSVEHAVVVKPHGNAKKGKRPYKRTCPSTLKNLEIELQQHAPKRAAFRVERKRGGILNASCAGDLPRNSLQASRIHCKQKKGKNNTSKGVTNLNDPLQELVVKFKEESKRPGQFIQSIRLVPDPTIVLFNEKQISDIEHFCASSGVASVLGIDVTFNLGRFYVTLCTYQNLNIGNNRGKHPIMVGPALVHSCKDQANFDILFQEITKYRPALATSLRAYGTDGEQALANAAATAFPFATHLRCANHLKDNIASQLQKKLLPQAVVKEVLNDIFGNASEKGLISAPIEEFDAKLILLQSRWERLEKEHKPSSSPVVFKWFKIHVAPIIRDNMRSELLRDLGLKEEKYTQNCSESLNALVKRYVNFQKQDLFQFVTDLKECVLEQQNEVSKAALGLGRWTPFSSYSHTEPDSNDCQGENTVSTETISAPNPHDRISPTTTACLSTGTSLSVSYTLLSGILSNGQLDSIWNKASRLLAERKVIKPPGGYNPKMRWVASDTNSSPHVVTTTGGNQSLTRYVCDKQCVGWKTHNICADCVAVAEDNNELDQFVLWFACFKGGKTNLTAAVYHDTYQHAGTKKPPRRKYGDVNHLPAEQKIDRLPLSDVSNLQLQAVHNDHSYATSVVPTSSGTVSSSDSPMYTTLTHVGGTGNTVGGMKPVQLCSTAQNVGTVNISTAASLPQVPCFSATLTNPLASLLSTIVPHLTLPTSQAFTYAPSMATSLSPKPPTMKSSQPFFIILINNRIKKCSGCGAFFEELQTRYILGHMERDWFPNSGQWHLGKLQNKYYHLKMSCVVQRCPLYNFNDFSTLTSKESQPLPAFIQEIRVKL